MKTNLLNNLLINISLLIILSSCSTSPDDKRNSSSVCQGAGCEVEQYEKILKEFGTIETELQNGNSFKALNELERIKPKAYYHGRFKSLYRLAQDICIKSTNEMSKLKNSCSTVRDRVYFIKTVSPDKLENVSQAIASCNIDISFNTSQFNLSKKEEKIELTQDEFSASNLYEEAMQIRQRYNSNPWEKLLLIDLEILASYHFSIGKAGLSKEMPNNKIRIIAPISIKQSGSKTSYCSQYRKSLHEKTFSQKLSCFDYPEISDHLSGIWRDSTGPHKWTGDTYLTEIGVSEEVKRQLSDLPITKKYEKLLVLEIKYASGLLQKEELTVEYPGDQIPKNLLARLAYTQKLSSKIGSTDNAPIILKAASQDGVVLLFYQSGSFGYEIKIDIPNEKTKDLQSLSLKIPIQSIRDDFHNQMSMK